MVSVPSISIPAGSRPQMVSAQTALAGSVKTAFGLPIQSLPKHVLTSTLTTFTVCTKVLLLITIITGVWVSGVQSAKADESKNDLTYLTIVAGGDIGLNVHAATVQASGYSRHGQFRGWTEATEGLEGLFDGDVNFANLETVVTAKNDLTPVTKRFNFRSHPVGIEHLTKLGLNFFSSANNHINDYGVAGIIDTLTHLQSWSDKGTLLGHAGIGLTHEQAALPKRIAIKSLSVSIAAIGIDSGGRATPQRAGILSWRSDDDFNLVTQALGRSDAQLKILSVHHGEELNVVPKKQTEQRLRKAVRRDDAQLMLGHHAHVAQGIEMIDGKVIFYGLGNLLHPGMTDMGQFDACRDYGLLAKIHYHGTGTTPLKLRAIEVIPLTNMHDRSRRMPPDEAGYRIRILNSLSQALGDGTVQFQVQSDGSGLFCVPQPEEADRIGKLCREWSPPVTQATSKTICIPPSRPLVHVQRLPTTGKEPRVQDLSWTKRVFGAHGE